MHCTLYIQPPADLSILHDIRGTSGSLVIMSTEQPYNISLCDRKLEQLATKLSDAKIPDELDKAGWGYGAPLSDVVNLTAYCTDRFDWNIS